MAWPGMGEVEGPARSRRIEGLSSSIGEARSKTEGHSPWHRPRQGHTWKGWYWSQPGKMAAPLKEGPPIPSTSQNGRALPWWWETGPWHLVPRLALRLPGQRAPAVAAGGCQHPLSRGAPAQAPTLPPSQALTLGRGGCSVPGSRNLRGASLGSRAPHYCFISRGPAKNNAGHETRGTRSCQLT